MTTWPYKICYLNSWGYSKTRSARTIQDAHKLIAELQQSGFKPYLYIRSDLVKQ